ncbi:hypothetical protein [Pelagibius sp. Alg239-R121]|uniref:hypothetical protein n=1 Tax=Pelagibius sp. Alg239-R121 TaxID=2993448 RepID=UPI0024A761A8|nr:hypothetical protein [Pelagibius sp. Alg239-R121]
MGKINVDLSVDIGAVENTLNEYDNEISEELLEHHLEQIASIFECSEDLVCYVLGMGSQPKSTYTELRHETGLDLIWSKSVLPDLFKPLSVFIASYAGLLKVLESEKLPSVVKKLCHMSMAGVYIIDHSEEQYFLDRVMHYPQCKEMDFGIKRDDRYFLYLVDADNAESSTGVYEVVSYGKRASSFANVL